MQRENEDKQLELEKEDDLQIQNGQELQKMGLDEQEGMMKKSQQQLDEYQEQLLDRDIEQQSQRIINSMTMHQKGHGNDLSNANQIMQSQQEQDPDMPVYDQDNQISNLQKNSREPDLNIEQIKNPVSAYMVFVKNWKRDNPDKKLNLSQMGYLFKQLTEEEKIPLIQQYKRQKEIYDAYRLRQHINNPNPKQSALVGVFPLHRVKCIMKQDSFYTSKAQAVAAMGKATQYFAEYFLEEIKKLTQGKNRVQAEDMYQCITAKNKVFGFLDCLNDERNFASKTTNRNQQVQNVEQIKMDEEKRKSKPNKPKVSLQIQNEDVYRKPIVKNIKSNQKRSKIPENQIKITDMFKM